MKHIETPDKMHLANILSELGKGSFNIPDFQREFEWQPGDIVELIKSIFMDYYIGTLLLWKAGDKNIEALSCEAVYGYEGKEKPQHIVLDGQQRLTALYYSIFSPDAVYPGRKNKCYFFIKVDKLLEENYDEAFSYEWGTKKIREIVENTDLQFKNKILPLGAIRDPWKFLEWVEGYKTYWSENGNPEEAKSESERIGEIVKDLHNNYYISYIELDREISVSKVCDIFAKINSKGVPLSIFDLLNAMLRPYEIKLKEKWRKDSDELLYTDATKMKIYVLQVMSILKQSYCSPRYLYFLVPNAKKPIRNLDGSKEQVVLIEDSREFIEKWDEAIGAIKKAISILKNPRDFGAISAKFMPYPSIIPALSAVKRYVEISDLEDKVTINEKIKKWYWASIFTKNYSSSVESQSAKDFNILKKWFKDDKMIPEVIIQFENDYKNLDLKNEKKQGSAIYNAIFNLLVLRGASDWSSFDLPEYSSLDDHHIVPASWGKNKVGDDINSILNKTPLSAETNRHVINSQMPSGYIKDMFASNNEEKVYELLESHLISKKAVDILLREDFRESDYYEFIEERKSAIIDAIGQLMIGESKQKPVDYSTLIDKGEDSNVEFKASMRWNYKANMIDKGLEIVVAKTICAFMNADGGTLFIGVEDSGNIISLERDYQTLGNKQSADEYQLKLVEVINRLLGKEHYHAISIQIINIGGKDVCVIEIEASNTPVFLKIESDEKFYVRIAAASEPMNTKQATEYIKKHF